MKVSGFSYVKNGFEFGYPFIESIQSILPVCDEFVIAVGESHDGTAEAISKLSPKIKIVNTIWDMNLRKNGKIFAQQANIAFDATSGDWAFHIQADEVIHERDLPKIESALIENLHNEKVEGFLLPFLHFWGNYDHIRNSRRVHNHEVRIIRNNKSIRSYADSQGFRMYSSNDAYEAGEKGKKLRVKKIDAPVYHYNGVRNINVQKKKMYYFDLYHTEKEDVDKGYEDFDFQKVDRVVPFTGSHPKVMEQKVSSQNPSFHFDGKQSQWKFKDRIMQPIEDRLGFKFGEYKNYILIK